MAKDFDLKAELRSFGASEESVLLLGRSESKLIDYLDLIPNNRTRHQNVNRVWLDAVVEVQHQPILYVIKSTTLAQDSGVRHDEIKNIRRDLACRGSGAYLAVIELGTIAVYPVGLSADLPEPYVESKKSQRNPFFIQDLAQGNIPEELAVRINAQKKFQAQAVHEILYELLNEVTDALIGSEPFNNDQQGKDDVLSLVGRALFTRFLIDRGIMNNDTFVTFDAPFEQCFSNAKNAEQTCRWLDEKFNGELLPLAGKNYGRYFKNLEANFPSTLNSLSQVLYRAPKSQLSFELYWNDINFAHVPVGLLSEVYEKFAHNHFGEHATRESVHYTPRLVADYMVNQAFPGITTAPQDRACILDPSAGAGVFLVLCLRRLVAERWKVTGAQPQTNEIRQILYDQIRGFDINGHALKLAALSLYLTSLELDPDPFPPDKLVFKPLLGKVLFNARLPGEEFPYDLPILGSLGPAISDAHNHQYDLIIGNPPWTPWTGDGSTALNIEVNKIIRKIAQNRAPERLKSIASGYTNARKVSDLPFIWRAMEWAKPDGVIALAMSARILFSRLDAVAENRTALLESLRITGILNGTALRRTKVWPDIKAPFCLIFAINRLPDDREAFHFISPQIDEACNTNGRMRIDYADSHPIQFSVLKQKPTLLKTLFRGNVLDATVMDHISQLETITVEEYLDILGLHHGEGYQKSGDKNLVPEFLGKQYLTAHNAPRYCVGPEGIDEKFDLEFLHRPRSPKIYKGPLLILRSSLQPERDAGCGIFSVGDMLFSESFYGYSSVGHPSGKDVIQYLYLLSYSQLLYYTVLLTSAKFGFEREVIYKEDFDQFPLIPLESISQDQVSEMHHICNAIANGERPWKRVDDWVGAVYELSQSDQQSITDTLQVSMPFSNNINCSQAAPSFLQVVDFGKYLEHALRPFFELTDEIIHVQPRTRTSSSWVFYDVYTGDTEIDNDASNDFISLLRSLADNEGASLIKAKLRNGHLMLAVLAQYRYLTLSRARLLSMDILRNSEEYFPVK